eukprot:COSAG05_NODE_2123_length_3527_cov_6.845974_3_plen_197_part_00
MPKQGPVYGHEERYPGASAARTQGCAKSYRSDIWDKSNDDIVPTRSRTAAEKLHQHRASTIEARVWAFRTAERFGKAAVDRMYCVASGSSSVGGQGAAGGEKDSLIAQLVLRTSSDCCRACIAEPKCGRFVHMPRLGLCRLHAQQFVIEMAEGPQFGGLSDGKLLTDAQVVAKGWTEVTGLVTQGIASRPILVEGT